MTGLLVAGALFCGFVLVLLTFVQVLYQEALRLHPQVRPSLEYFKENVLPRVGVEAERGVLMFSLLKHTSLLIMGATFFVLGWQWRNGNYVRPMIEAFLFAWLTMLAATYVLPHILYRRSRARWLGAAVPFLRLLAIVLKPFVSLFAFFQSLTEMGGSAKDAQEDNSQEENIDALINAGQEEGLIEESDRELIESVVAFGDTRVREVMTPRPNIVAIEASESLETLRQLVINEQYSRIPVFEGSIDSIIGFVHVRDMFDTDEAERRTRSVRELVRPIRAVPETKPVNDLLKEMQTDRAHMAVVVDEYGNTAGLVTMEDLVEEIFGEIRDEHEPGVDVVHEPGGGYVVSGNFGVDGIEELLGFRPDAELESTTVGGLVTEWLGRVPHPGEAVERDGIRVDVLSSNDLRVEKVRLSKSQQARHAS